MNNKLRSYLKIFGIFAVVITVLGYSYFEARDILSGPRIDITTPENGSAVSRSLLIIEGETKNIAEISLNDRKIFTDESGKFIEELLLSPGYNIIKIKARDRFGREIKKLLEIIY